jgi:hypothetical protein
LRLRPRESEQITFAISQFPSKKEPALLPERGHLTLVVRYACVPGDESDQLKQKQHTLRAAEPAGVDAPVYQLLKENPALPAALMSRFTSRIQVDDKHVRQALEHLILRFPTSSYTPYARLALARIYVGGLSGMSRTTEDAKLAAQSLLEPIEDIDWPYAPTALLWQESLAQSNESRARIRRKLETRYWDSLELQADEAELLVERGQPPPKEDEIVIRMPRRKPGSQ